MFNLGDKVFYPLHGAGTIKSIENREILGEQIQYYIISMPGDVTIMVPTDKAQNLGLRNIVSKDEAVKVLKDLTEDMINMSDNWSERYQENKEILKTGDIESIAEIYKSLSFRNKEKNLSTTEKKLMFNAKQVLFSELSLSLDTTEKDIENQVKNIFTEYDMQLKQDTEQK